MRVRFLNKCPLSHVIVRNSLPQIFFFYTTPIPLAFLQYWEKRCSMQVHKSPCAGWYFNAIKTCGRKIAMRTVTLCANHVTYFHVRFCSRCPPSKNVTISNLGWLLCSHSQQLLPEHPSNEVTETFLTPNQIRVPARLGVDTTIASSRSHVKDDILS